MKYKKGLIFICLLICLFSIASVCANEITNESKELSCNENDYQYIGLIDNEKIRSSDGNSISNSIDENLNIDTNIESNKLSDSRGTFTDLINDINNGKKNVNLSRNYIYDDSIDSNYVNGINITNNIIINGNGHYISGNKITQIFEISGDNVVLKNIVFMEGRSNVNGGAILWRGCDGNLFNCSFINCAYVSTEEDVVAAGGAVYWEGNNGKLNNCYFEDCYTDSIIRSEGGAVYWEGNNGKLYNSTFINCYSNSRHSEGGAVHWYSNNGKLYNSTFINCYASSSISYDCNGGSIYWIGGNGFIDKCNFISCYSYSSNSEDTINTHGGAVYWIGKNGTLTRSNFENCYSKSYSLNYEETHCESYGGAVYWWADDGIIYQCKFSNCNAFVEGSSKYTSSKSYLGGGALFFIGKRNIIATSNFINCYASSKTKSDVISSGGAIYFGGNTGIVIDSNLTNCYVTSSNPQENLEFSHIKGGAIYWEASNSLINNCTFNHCSVKTGLNFRSGGGAVYVIGDEKLINNSRFINCTSARNGGAVYTEGNYLNITSSIFIDNNAPSDSGIYFREKSGIIKDSILIKNHNNPVIFVENNKITANYNWWGNTIENYNVYPHITSGTIVDNWLYLDLILEKNSIAVDETSKLKFNINNLVTNGVVSNYVNSMLSDFNVNIFTDYHKSNIIINRGYGEFKYVGTNTPEGYILVKYLNNEKLFNITIGKGETKILAPLITTEYNSGKTLVITLKNNYGHIIKNAMIKVSFNGKTNEIYTNNNGEVKISTKGLTPKSYGVKIVFNGNKNYLSSYTSTKITVKKATPKLTVKSKTFKKSIKVKKYSIILKDNLGKTIKNAKVTLKIDKKTYNAKTNSKGKATFKIKKLIKKFKYNVIVTYKGNNYYNKVTKKVKITVK